MRELLKSLLVSEVQKADTALAEKLASGRVIVGTPWTYSEESIGNEYHVWVSRFGRATVWVEGRGGPQRWYRDGRGYLKAVQLLEKVGLIQRTIDRQGLWARLQPEDFRALTPLFYGHINPYGAFELDLEGPSFLEAA